MENLLNTIFPPKCLFCGSVGDIFCSNCLSTCNLVDNQTCILCQKPSEDGFTHEKCLKDGVPSRLVCIYEYEGYVRGCIRRSKYSPYLFMALKRLSFEGANIAFEDDINFDGFTLIPIPISPKRYKERGFNQVNVITKALSRRFNLPIDVSIINRIKDTKAQHNLERRDRFLNVKGSFRATKSVVGRKFLLVDDICTTGATFIETSKVLFEAGASDVWCFGLSKKI